MMLTVKQVANRLGKKPTSITMAIAQGRLKASKFGRAWAIEEEDLNKMIDRRKKKFKHKEEKI